MLIYLLRNQKIRVKMFAVLLFYLTETCCVVVLSVSGVDTSQRKVSVLYTATQQLSDHNRLKLCFNFLSRSDVFVLSQILKGRKISEGLLTYY